MPATPRCIKPRAGRATTASYTALPSWVARSDAERAWQCTGALETVERLLCCHVHQLCSRAMATMAAEAAVASGM